MDGHVHMINRQFYLGGDISDSYPDGQVDLPRIRKAGSDLLGPGAPGAPLAVPRTVRELPEVPIDVFGQGGAPDDPPPPGSEPQD